MKNQLTNVKSNNDKWQWHNLNVMNRHQTEIFLLKWSWIAETKFKHEKYDFIFLQVCYLQS